MTSASGAARPPWHDVDPFDLPEWLGTTEVVWRVGDRAACAAHRLPGSLLPETAGPPALACDVLAVDEAFPAPVMEDDLRTRAHQAWRHGSIVVLAPHPGPADAVVVAVPGRRIDAPVAFEALARLARAVGADPRRWSVQWRLGGDDA
ncbi:hypothetical protein GCM10022215_35570 [Nocardioides fonticola]|uniref:Uncharacterized protein n=1 Tax=Nocardioides fonticola TaxID=450363 RepID=A0ABP7XV54_9ACTN